MSFQEYAESHGLAGMFSIDRKVLVGIVLVVVLVMAAVVGGVFHAGDTFAVSTGNDSSYVETSVSYSAQSLIVVDVSGEVVNPGVYQLESGSRICDAIAAAGGFTQEANTQAVNQAKQLADGDQIIVPSAVNEAQAAQTATSSMVEGKVNINTATAEELTSVSGIGESTAKKIVADRKANGLFSSVDDLTRVSGIGEKKVEAWREYLCAQ